MPCQLSPQRPLLPVHWRAPLALQQPDPCSLCRARSVRVFAEAFKALGVPLHVLALNASPFEWRYRRCGRAGQPAGGRAGAGSCGSRQLPWAGASAGAEAGARGQLPWAGASAGAEAGARGQPVETTPAPALAAPPRALSRPPPPPSWATCTSRTCCCRSCRVGAGGRARRSCHARAPLLPLPALQPTIPARRASPRSRPARAPHLAGLRP